MQTTAAIVKEHRDATRKLRQRIKDPAEARKLLIRAGILAKDGRRLSSRYR